MSTEKRSEQSDRSVSEPESDPRKISKPSVSANYHYPRNIAKTDDASEDTESGFYPIGFSMDGKFAFLYRPCDEGCGCCTHLLAIQDLMTDKIIAQLDLKIPRQEEVSDYRQEWNLKSDNIRTFLKKHNILQQDFSLNESTSIEHNGSSYDVSTLTTPTTDDDDYLGNEALKYVVKVSENGIKSKIVSSRKVSDGISIVYMGYISSPYSDHVVLAFKEKYRGWEASMMENISLVGCILDTRYF